MSKRTARASQFGVEAPTHLRVAALGFEVTPEADMETDSRTGARVVEVAGSLKTTVMLLDDGVTQACLIATSFGPTTPVNVSELFRETIARDLGLSKSRVLIFSSHNHSSPSFASNGKLMYHSYAGEVPEAELWPVGEMFLGALREHAKRLPGLLQPVRVWWAEGHEGRITYNRKGRRPDGTTYLMREQDRKLLGEDFAGDIDTQAPVVVFKNVDGEAVAALVQFTGHPVTSYHPEHPVVFGDLTQVACDVLAEHLAAESDVPVAFLQGCAGDVNSKEMFVGGVKRATEFGRMLGQSYIDALENLRPSESDGLEVAVEIARVPLASLPSREVLAAELEEMDDFIRRAKAGDENTMSCVGLNFARALSPAYRASLIELVRPWNVWALDLHARGQAAAVADYLEMEIAVIRLGDVGIAGLPCEPFQGIGRQIRRGSPMRLTIPCGYMNVSHGYITDSENTGDREYMSSHYRYSRFRPPLRKPAGDAIADHVVGIFKRIAAEETSHRD